jgi:hypothetical protein
VPAGGGFSQIFQKDARIEKIDHWSLAIGRWPLAIGFVVDASPLVGGLFSKFPGWPRAALFGQQPKANDHFRPATKGATAVSNAISQQVDVNY